MAKRKNESTFAAKYEKLQKKYEHEKVQPVDINDFRAVEATLYLFEQVSQKDDPDYAYLLFSGATKINSTGGSQKEAFLQRAINSDTLIKFRSRFRWQEYFGRYQHEMYEGLRIYNIIETDDGQKRLQRNKPPICPFEVREKYWQEKYFSPERPFFVKYNQKSYKHHQFMYSLKTLATVEEEKEDDEKNLHEMRSVQVAVTIDQLPEIPAQVEANIRETREEISISISEILECAKEMGEIDPSDHSYRILKENDILEINDHKVGSCQRINIHEVVNFVGMVGSGKSTLIRVLAYWANKNNYRMTIITDTVANVLTLAKNLHDLGVNVSPLIGKSNRTRYINQLFQPNKMLLDPYYSSYLTTACYLDGLSDAEENACEFGEEPCFMVHPLREDKTGFKKSNETCPFFNVCDKTKMLRDCYDANIVVTTAQALILTRVGPNQQPFLNLVLHTFDMVVFDECDAVQKTLDTHFAPTVSFDEFIKQSSNDINRFARLSPEEREQSQLQDFDNYARLSAPYMTKIVQALSVNLGRWKPIEEGSYISSYILLVDLYDSGYIPDEIFNKILSMMATITQYSYSTTLNNVVDSSLDGDLRHDTDYFIDAYNLWREENKDVFPLPTDEKELEIQNNRIKLILKLIRFFRYLTALERSIDSFPDEEKNNSKIYQFLSRRFSNRHNFLPAALIGNVVGIQVKNKDLILYRQSGFGRSLMKDMPYLILSDDGKPLGPHVLMFSGSSWAKGSLTYHVHRPVSYILDIPDKKKEFLSRTSFIFPKSAAIRVSGSGKASRIKHIKELINESMSEIIYACEQTSGKILMVVNSYAECIALEKHLNDHFYKEKSQKKISVAAMIPDHAKEEENTIRRSDIHKFASSKYDILVAPALAIERGHNIVDETGHAAITHLFFVVRPMPVPDELDLVVGKMNGIIESIAQYEPDTSIVAYNREVRHRAIVEWHKLLRQRNLQLGDLDELSKKDVIATLFIVILQTFGRMARISDTEKEAPTVHFLDGAFLKNPSNPFGFDCLHELNHYMEELFSSEDGSIAQALYGPFFEAFSRDYKNFCGSEHEVIEEEWEEGE